MKKQYLIFCVPVLLVGLSLGENIHNYWHGLGFKSFGNLADWVMVGVTAVTLYFLYQQFEEMRKQTAALKRDSNLLAIQQYQNEMRECLMRVARLFDVAAKERLSPWYLNFGSIGRDEQEITLKQKLSETYALCLNGNDGLSLVRTLREILSHPFLDIFEWHAVWMEVSHYCNRLQKLYKLLRQMDHQNVMQDSFCDECNAFAEEFLEKYNTLEQQTAYPIVTPAKAGV